MKKFNWKMVAVAVLSVVAVAMSAGTLARVLKNEETKEISSFAFEVGAVTAEGKVDEDADTAIVSELITLDGLKIELDKEANVGYKLHYYDKEEKYLESTTTLSTKFVASDTVIPENAEYVCVEVIPTSDSDGVSFFEKFEYLKQITVTVNK